MAQSRVERLATETEWTKRLLTNEGRAGLDDLLRTMTLDSELEGWELSNAD